MEVYKPALRSSSLRHGITKESEDIAADAAPPTLPRPHDRSNSSSSNSSSGFSGRIAMSRSPRRCGARRPPAAAAAAAAVTTAATLTSMKEADHGLGFRQCQSFER
eukprot:364279-Chlamydomonas_euryale.AAC.4